jgi:hypothetical protein
MLTIPFLFVDQDDSNLCLSVYESLLSTLSKNYKVEVISTTKEVSKILSESNLKVVLIGDAGILNSKSKSFIPKYLKNGGTILFCGLFGQMSSPKDFDEFFKFLKMSWRYGEYFRTTHFVQNTNKFNKLPLKCINVDGSCQK